MAPLPCLASHKPGWNSLGTERGEGNQQGCESGGLPVTVAKSRCAWPFKEAHHAETCARFGAILVCHKILK